MAVVRASFVMAGGLEMTTWQGLVVSIDRHGPLHGVGTREGVTEERLVTMVFV